MGFYFKKFALAILYAGSFCLLFISLVFAIIFILENPSFFGLNFWDDLLIILVLLFIPYFILIIVISFYLLVIPASIYHNSRLKYNVSIKNKEDAETILAQKHNYNIGKVCFLLGALLFFPVQIAVFPCINYGIVLFEEKKDKSEKIAKICMRRNCRSLFRTFSKEALDKGGQKKVLNKMLKMRCFYSSLNMNEVLKNRNMSNYFKQKAIKDCQGFNHPEMAIFFIKNENEINQLMQKNDYVKKVLRKNYSEAIKTDVFYRSVQILMPEEKANAISLLREVKYPEINDFCWMTLNESNNKYSAYKCLVENNDSRVKKLLSRPLPLYFTQLSAEEQANISLYFDFITKINNLQIDHQTYKKFKKLLKKDIKELSADELKLTGEILNKQGKYKEASRYFSYCLSRKDCDRKEVRAIQDQNYRDREENSSNDCKGDKVYICSGDREFEEGNYSKALKKYRIAAHKNSDWPEEDLKLAKGFYYVNYHKTAYKHIQKYLNEQNEFSKEANYYAGLIALKMGDKQQARQYFIKADKQYSEDEQLNAKVKKELFR